MRVASVGAAKWTTLRRGSALCDVAIGAQSAAQEPLFVGPGLAWAACATIAASTDARQARRRRRLGARTTQYEDGRWPAEHRYHRRGRSERDIEFVGPARTAVAALSPDGRFLYATTRGIEHVSALAIAPYGRTLYAAANTRGANAVFRRNRHTGALRQLAGRRGCLGSGDHADGCAPARGLANAATLLVSADGRNVYAESLGNSRTFSVASDISRRLLARLAA